MKRIHHEDFAAFFMVGSGGRGVRLTASEIRVFLAKEDPNVLTEDLRLVVPAFGAHPTSNWSVGPSGDSSESQEGRTDRDGFEKRILLSRRP